MRFAIIATIVAAVSAIKVEFDKYDVSGNPYDQTISFEKRGCINMEYSPIIFKKYDLKSKKTLGKRDLNNLMDSLQYHLKSYYPLADEKETWKTAKKWYKRTIKSNSVRGLPKGLS